MNNIEEIAKNAILAGLVSAFTTIITSFIVAIPVEILWNFFMVEFFNFAPISYWNSWCLYCLAQLLFGRR